MKPRKSDEAKIIAELNSIGVVYVENNFIFSRTEEPNFEKITDKKIKLEKDGVSVIRENIDEVQIGIEQIGDKIKISSSPNLIFESIKSGADDELTSEHENKWLLKDDSDGNIKFTVIFQYKGKDYVIERQHLIDKSQIKEAKTVEDKLKRIGILYDEGSDEFIFESELLIDFTTDEDNLHLRKESVTVTKKKNDVDKVNVQIEQHGDKLKVTNITTAYEFESLLYDQDKKLNCDENRTFDLQGLDGETHFLISITKNGKLYKLKRTLNIKGDYVKAARAKLKIANFFKKKARKMKALAAAKKVQSIIRMFQAKQLLKKKKEEYVNENCQFLLEPVESTSINEINFSDYVFGSIDDQNYRVYKNYLGKIGYFDHSFEEELTAAYEIVDYGKSRSNLEIHFKLKQNESLTITHQPIKTKLCHYNKQFAIKFEGTEDVKQNFSYKIGGKSSVKKAINNNTVYRLHNASIREDVTILNENSTKWFWNQRTDLTQTLKIIFAVKEISKIPMLSGGDDFSDDGAYSPTTVMTEDLLSDEEEEEQQEEKPKFRVVEVQLGAGRSWRKALSLEKDGYYRVFTGAGRSRVVAVPPGRVRPDSTQAKGDLVYDVRGRATRLVQRMLPDGPEAPPIYAVRNLNQAPFGRGPFAPRVLLLRADEVRAPTEEKLLAGGQALSPLAWVLSAPPAATTAARSFPPPSGPRTCCCSRRRGRAARCRPRARCSSRGGRGGLRMATFDGETVDADGRLACTFGKGERGWVNPADVFVDNLRGGELVREKGGGVYRLVQRDTDGRCWVRNLNRSRFGGREGPTLKAFPASDLRLV